MASPVTIAASVGASMSAATGRPGQSHLVYAVNQGAWWLLYLTSTKSLSALYSSGFASWTAPTGSPFSLALGHDSEGRCFGFAYANIASIDIIHCSLTYAGSIPIASHARFTLGTTLTNTNAEASIGSTLSDTSPSGSVVFLNSASKPYDLGPYWNISGSGWGEAAIASNADSGTSWTAGFGSPFTFNSHVTQYAESFAGFSLGSGTFLLISDNSATTHNFTQLWSSTFASSSHEVAVLGSTVTSTSAQNWGAVARTTSDVHVVALSDNSASYVHRRFNGSSWANGDTVPTLTYGTLSGIMLATDGTLVYAHVIDSSGNVNRSIWTSGTGWSAWSVVCAIVTNARAYLSGCQTVVGGNVGLIWTEHNGSNYDILGALVSTSISGAGSGAALLPAM